MISNCPKWLNSAVFYQIYPQSFKDTNGDGVGDIQGIIEKLSYIESLGCNAIWINPCFMSPFHDAGYDIADYYRVAPRYGTNADLKRLFGAAKARGIRVCLDLVPAHTSVEHPWFKESSKAQKNKYSNWYIWTDNVWGRTDDNGVKTVNGYAERDGNYATSFFWCQPALNYGFAEPDPSKPWQLPTDHPDVLGVRREMKNIMRYWLDRGASGFRVDMAGTLVKGDSNEKATMNFWREIRGMFDRSYPDAALIAEWFCPTNAIRAGFHVDFMPPSETAGYTSLFRQEQGRNVFSTEGHSFFDKAGKGDISLFLDSFMKHYKGTRNSGYISIPTGNHDLPRISLGRNQKEIELVFAFILTMPGVPFIYYGDEIGMRYLNLPSKEGGYNRTGSRTPMQWDTTRNAGFSSSAKRQLYLPIDRSSNRSNVESQEKNPRSLLNRVRRLVQLRNREPVLQGKGKFTIVYAKPKRYPLVYLRSHRSRRILVAINPSAGKVKAVFKLFGVKSVGDPVAGSGMAVKARNGKFFAEMEGISYAIFICA